MHTFHLITSYPVQECLKRIRSMTDSPLQIHHQQPAILPPLRVTLNKLEIMGSSPDRASAALPFQSTLSGWRYDYIPIWVTGTLVLILEKHNHGTEVVCTHAARRQRHKRMVPLEMAFWLLLLAVQGTFIIRAVREPIIENLTAVVIFAAVPLFFVGVKFLLHRGTKAVLEQVLQRALDAKSP